LLLTGVSDGAETVSGVKPAFVAPPEFSTGATDAPLQSPITPMAKFAVIVHVYDAGSLAPATWEYSHEVATLVLLTASRRIRLQPAGIVGTTEAVPS
jgi:hypothetical protein